MTDLEKFSADVVLELTEMKKIGMKVPKKAIEMAKDLTEMAEYENMGVSDCADLLISIANIK